MRVDYYQFDELSSTNTFAKENLFLFSPENLSVITADRQTHGRGRRERSWISASGNLFMTLVFQTVNPLSTPMQLALACCQVLKEFNPKIKWPNDILIEGKKVSGILGERVDDWMILGIGVNLNGEVDLPDALSLHALGKRVNVKEFAQDLVEAFHQKPDFRHIESYSVHRKGDLLTMKTEQDEIRGYFQGFGPLGELKLEVEGKELHLFSGEIV